MKISRSFLVWSFACAIFLGACSPGGSVNPTGSASQQVPGETYTLADIAKHNTPDDCWMAIHGKVYDVSGFGSSGHPGGQAIYQGCGIDATTLFETRPMGSGTPHSQLARALMDHFYIGDLKT